MTVLFYWRLYFVVDGPVVACPRTRGRNRVNPPDYEVYKRVVRDAAEQAWHHREPFPSGQACRVDVTLGIHDAQHDGDRVLNTVLDALTGFCWPDDSLRYVRSGSFRAFRVPGPDPEWLEVQVAPDLSGGFSPGSR